MKPLLTIARSMRCSALLHRLLGQADKHRFRQRTGRNIDLHLDGQGVDAEQRKGVQLGEHGGQCIRASAVAATAAIELCAARWQTFVQKVYETPSDVDFARGIWRSSHLTRWAAKG